MRYQDPDTQSALSVWSFVFGPMALLPQSFFGGIALLLISAAMGMLTVTGGIVTWIATPMLARVHERFSRSSASTAAMIVTFLVFAALQWLNAWVVTPRVAVLFGRVPLPCLDGAATLQPATRWTCLMSRNYVTPALKSKLEGLAAAMGERYPGFIVYYLDAGFAVGLDIPMAPHAQHRTGRHVDLSYAYIKNDASGTESVRPPSPFGYWKYEQPRVGEPTPCREKVTPLRWDFPSLQEQYADWRMDAPRTRDMISWLLTDMSTPVRRIFLEPHLIKRLGLTDSRVRFQGCGAARHDDHLHLEI